MFLLKLFRRPDPLKVFLAIDVIKVEWWANEVNLVPSQDLKLWLSDYPGQYKFGYDKSNGKRWVEFKDKNVAMMCRLTFA